MLKAMLAGFLQRFHGRTGAFRRAAAVVVAVALLWLGTTGLSFADLRIVHDTEGIRSETLFKGNRIAVLNPEGMDTLFYCDVQEIVMIAPYGGGRYWQGTLDELMAGFEALFSPEALGGFGDLFGDMDLGDDEMAALGELGDVFGALFGGGGDKSEPLRVRVSKVGDETVAGYAAEHYVVEAGRGGTWDVQEEVWIAPALLAELTRESGRCVALMMDVQNDLLAGLNFGDDDMFAVINSEEYRAVMERGYPVRTKEIVSFFGMSFETVSEVVEVGKEAIPADKFGVPAGYTRVDDLMEMLMFDPDM